MRSTHYETNLINLQYSIENNIEIWSALNLEEQENIFKMNSTETKTEIEPDFINQDEQNEEDEDNNYISFGVVENYDLEEDV
jgi:hypothetical protein